MSQNETILIIDDQRDNIEFLKNEVLPDTECTVTVAYDGQQGLEMARREKPDLVIVDLMMEEVDAGTNFVKELKLLGCSVPIYMLSSVGDTLSMSTSYTELGLSGVLQKPISPNSLLALLKDKLS